MLGDIFISVHEKKWRWNNKTEVSLEPFNDTEAEWEVSDNTKHIYWRIRTRKEACWNTFERKYRVIIRLFVSYFGYVASNVMAVVNN
jgi:hypothetical protein